MKSKEELELEVLNLTEEVRVLKENETTHVKRIKELEGVNTELYNKVIVQHKNIDKKEDQDDEEIVSFDDFLNNKIK